MEIALVERLTWDEIKRQYDGEWVELVDYVWDEGEPYPIEGMVRTHSPSRKVFNRLVLEWAPADAARLFVGNIARKQERCAGETTDRR
jgi:hypothetical protein